MTRAFQIMSSQRKKLSFEEKETHLWKSVLHKSSQMVFEQYKILSELEEDLKFYNLKRIGPSLLSKKEKKMIEELFDTSILPLLNPVNIKDLNFKSLQNNQLNIALILKDNYGIYSFITIEVPDKLSRIVKIDNYTYILLEDIIKDNLNKLFHDRQICCSYVYRVTFNYIKLKGHINFLSTDFIKHLKKKKRSSSAKKAVRLEVEATMDIKLINILCEKLNIFYDEVFFIKGPIDLKYLGILRSIYKKSELIYDTFEPNTPVSLKTDDIFKAIRDKDILLHHPYDSFEPVIRFLKQSAHDPHVLCIRQVIYRVSTASPVIDALIEAADLKKHVTVVIEPKAKFDEENNLLCGLKLENAGCHVIYGINGMKVHSKLTQVLRLEGEKVKSYIHLGTGNYNEITAKTNTVFILFTPDENFALAACNRFNLLAVNIYPHDMKDIIISPFYLRKHFEFLIEAMIEYAKEGKECEIFAKMNSLTDKKTIDLLYKASIAGVNIKLIVRGICKLRPKIDGLSDKIQVKSVVGRFLEHSRVYCFKTGEDVNVYLSSADLMARNLDKRIETAFLIEDPLIKTNILNIMEMYWNDTENSSYMTNNGEYKLIQPADINKRYDVHKALISNRHNNFSSIIF